MNASHMNFYLNANSVREFILDLCHLSELVFEVSLNSSLVTDELSSQGEELRSYAVYSEKMNVISNSLNLITKSMLKNSTSIMELSLEKTELLNRMSKIEEACAMISEGDNEILVSNAVNGLSQKILPIRENSLSVMTDLNEDLKSFNHEKKKLWLLSTFLKTQVAFDEISYLTTINSKIDSILQKIEVISEDLGAKLKEMEGII